MKTITVIIILLYSNILFSQNVIHFKNPSFEGTPMLGGRFGPLPEGWFDCGFRGETPPDIHPVPNSAFEVDTYPFDGETYLGMVTRDNDTWEKVVQKLENPIKANTCYSFSVALARSDSYFSVSRLTNQPVYFTTPIKLKVYGGNEFCSKEQFLAETDLINHIDWKIYELNFVPEKDFNFILFEVFYEEPTLFSYNGNILLDALSPINKCDIPDQGIIYFPTAFSPNNDGVNDFFTGFSGNENVIITSLEIFDRWGNMVFLAEKIKANHIESGWDGYFNGKLVDPGVYVFLAEIIDSEFGTFQTEGTVSILR